MEFITDCPVSYDGKHHWTYTWDMDEQCERERCLKCGVFADAQTKP